MRMRRNIWGAVPLAPLRQHVAVAAFRAWSRSAAQPSRRVVSSSSRSRGAWRAVSRCRAREAALSHFPRIYPCPYCRHHMTTLVFRSLEPELYPLEAGVVSSGSLSLFSL